MAQVHVVSGSEPELRVWCTQRQVLRASYYPVIVGASFAEKIWSTCDPQLLWKTVWDFLTTLPSDPAIALLVVYLAD